MNTMDMYRMTDGVSELVLRHWAHLDPLSSPRSKVNVSVIGKFFNAIRLWRMKRIRTPLN